MKRAGILTRIEENKRREGCVGKTWGKEPVCKAGGNDINMNMKETGCNNVDWIYLAQDTDQYWVLVNMTMNISIFTAQLEFHYHEVRWPNFCSPVVTICTAQWSLYVPHSGHYMYRTVVTICTAQWSLYVPHSGHHMYSTVVTVCTAQWSLYVPHSGHYMYRTVVTICTAQWSLYVPHSGHYMNRTVVTICTAQWSLYVPHSGHYMYRTVVTICAAQWSLYVPPV